jgi:hypothetical protein
VNVVACFLAHNKKAAVFFLIQEKGCGLMLHGLAP